MATVTLFDELNPLMRIINIFGLKFEIQDRRGAQQNRGKLRLQKLLSIFFLGIYVWSMTLTPTMVIGKWLLKHRYDIGDNDKKETFYSSMPIVGQLVFYIPLNTFAYFHLRRRQSEIITLTASLKKYPTGRSISKALKRQVKWIIAVIFIEILISIYHHVSWFVYDFGKSEHTRIDVANAFLVIPIGKLIFGTMATLVPLIATFTSLIASYCHLRLNDLIEEIQKARSPIRKAKLTTALIDEYYRLRSLAIDTDRIMSPLMTVTRMFLVIILAFDVNLRMNRGFTYYTDEINRFITPTALTVTVIYYLRSAAQVNTMKEAIARTINHAQSTSDDRFLVSRELLTMRLNHLWHVVHMRLDQGCFTLYSIPVEDHSILSLFMESYDMYNLVGT